MTSERIRLMLVDDEEDLREILVENLELSGYQVISANSGNKAIELLKNNKVDLIISDIRMANGDGIFLLDNIRKADPKLPVLVFMTGYSDVAPDDCLERGAHSVLTKPFSHEALVEAIERALGK